MQTMRDFVDALESLDDVQILAMRGILTQDDVTQRRNEIAGYRAAVVESFGEDTARRLEYGYV